jgi:N-dimethylarginine dimethylaminohydrolase
MCPPDHFAVTYTINPWMDPQQWARDAMRSHRTAKQQWDDLTAALISKGANVYAMASPPGLPDLVFTANAAVVLDRKALLARFRHAERRGEEPVYHAVFQALHVAGFIDELVRLPDDVVLEGAGDCIWDTARGLFWMGHGFRSDLRAATCIERTFGQRCVPLQLADARFYHLDTALCALPCGGVLHFPGAFTPQSLEALHNLISPPDRIALDEPDACAFAANAVVCGQTIAMSRCSPALRRRLEERGYAVIETPLDSFLQSGGSACCLTLRLDHRAALAVSAARSERLSA